MATDMKVKNEVARTEAERVYSENFSDVKTEISAKPRAAKVADILNDEKDQIEKSFEEMPCIHDITAPKYEKVDCIRCKFNEREIWLQEYLNQITGTETISQFDVLGNPLPDATIKKIIVKRGKFDDVIGVSIEWQ